MAIMKYQFVRGNRYSVGESYSLTIGELAKTKAEEKFDKYSTEYSYGIFVKHTRLLLDKLNLSDEQIAIMNDYINGVL